jgi:hypothetical protein
MVSSERKWEGLQEVISDKMEQEIYKNGIVLFIGRFKMNGETSYCRMKSCVRERDGIEVNGSRKWENRKMKRVLKHHDKGHDKM